MKYYAVYKGKSVIPKIYTSWDECKKDVIGFKGAIYKSFTTEKEAKEFISLNSQGKKLENIQDEESESGLFIYVDGSFTVDKGNFSYGLVAVNDGKIIYEDKGIGFDKEAIALLSSRFEKINIAITSPRVAPAPLNSPHIYKKYILITFLGA